MFWYYWEKYKFQMISGAIIVLTLLVWVGFLIAGQTRVRDITLMSELKAVSSGLESYYSQHAGYPESSDYDLRQSSIIDDSGIAPTRKSSGTVYYDGRVSAGKATYRSDGMGYEIRFKLQRGWPVVGTTKKNCVIRAKYQISCT